MSANKNRDLAQELVDFLLKEEKGGVAAPVLIAKENSENENGTAPLIKQETKPATDAQKTFALQKTGAQLRKLSKVAPAVEFDLDLGDGAPPEVDFVAPSIKARDVLEKSSPNGFLENANKPQQTLRRPDNVAQSARARTIFTEVNSLLGGMEAVRVAQARIITLESERDVLRTECDKLLATSDSLKSRIDELKATAENQDRRHREKIEILEEEKVVIRSRLSAKEKELDDIKKQHQNLQISFQHDLRKVRVRERDLENRQELLKAESTAVVRSKDEMILELKRQLEQLHFELNNFRTQFANMNATLSEYDERNSRTVKALRLALSVLELSDAEDRIKKTGSGG